MNKTRERFALNQKRVEFFQTHSLCRENFLLIIIYYILLKIITNILRFGSITFPAIYRSFFSFDTFHIFYSCQMETSKFYTHPILLSKKVLLGNSKSYRQLLKMGDQPF